MDRIYAKARAKVNLTLNVLDKREDNYHNIETVFQKINLYDEIYVEKRVEDGIGIISNIEELNNENNIMCKAYVLLKKKYGDKIGGVQVHLTKHIPMQAGLAGGSTDCASFILCVDKLFDLHLREEELIQFAQKLGADVPACMYDVAVKGEGIGEKITKISTKMKFYIVLVKPEAACDTKIMYERIDSHESELDQKYDSDKMIEALEEENIEKIARYLYNVFEKVIEHTELIEKVKRDLIDLGALGSLMSGSGSCVFGVFRNKEEAKKAYKIMKQNYKTYICLSYNKGGNYFDKRKKCYSGNCSSWK